MIPRPLSFRAADNPAERGGWSAGFFLPLSPAEKGYAALKEPT
jgi:hypothetical protein